MAKKTLLVFGAHMDDCEIGAGGLICKALAKGHQVVLVVFCSDYSTWCSTKGREDEVKSRVMDKAKAMGVEKHLLGYGYQSIPNTLDTIRRVARIAVDVKPDVVLFHSRREREPGPADHAVVGEIVQYAIGTAATVLGGIRTSYAGEMYAYEVYPRSPFNPDTYIDIGDVIRPTVENIDYFGREIYGGHSAEMRSRICLGDQEEEVKLWHYGEVKLALSVYRGTQCGCRFAEAYESVYVSKLVGKKSQLEEMICS
ncbi:MAG: PIG-L family deacetylase [Kiritimatiellae bacterium]|jgi:LmbE family N-acetylglucosaminyl deacetylase|nr:PIG-L family deacetylase [Kiritimatiellia bacterium]